MVKDKISVEVAFATPTKQLIIPVGLPAGASVHEAITDSDILESDFDIDLKNTSVGIYGRVCKLDQILKDGDRVEIYRPLMLSPMDARRNRAIRSTC